MDDHQTPVPEDPLADRTGSTSGSPAEVNTESNVHLSGQVDIIAMVRSLQRTAGTTDCFRRGNADCDRIDCDWRIYCLYEPFDPKKTKRPPDKKKQ